jgi:hypothetical protein
VWTGEPHQDAGEPHLTRSGSKEYDRYIRSGELSGMRMLNLFGIYVGFESLEVLTAPA